MKNACRSKNVNTLPVTNTGAIFCNKEQVAACQTHEVNDDGLQERRVLLPQQTFTTC